MAITLHACLHGEGPPLHLLLQFLHLVAPPPLQLSVVLGQMLSATD